MRTYPPQMAIVRRVHAVKGRMAKFSSRFVCPEVPSTCSYQESPMNVRTFVALSVIAALATSSVAGLAQTQAGKTGTGGVGAVAGQEGTSLATTAIIAAAVIAAAVGIAVAIGGDDSNSGPGVAASVVSTTTTR
jgi:hypothetical protein